MRAYHPKAEGTSDSHTYLQLANSERTKAAILQDGWPKGEVVVYPKRLVPELTYEVVWRGKTEKQQASGAELMS